MNSIYLDNSKTWVGLDKTTQAYRKIDMLKILILKSTS